MNNIFLTFLLKKNIASALNEGKKIYITKIKFRNNKVLRKDERKN